jgi:hypothetical protein
MQQAVIRHSRNDEVEATGKFEKVSGRQHSDFNGARWRRLYFKLVGTVIEREGQLIMMFMSVRSAIAARLIRILSRFRGAVLAVMAECVRVAECGA